MRPIIISLLCAGGLLFVPASPAQARDATKLLDEALRIKRIHDDLDKYHKAIDYAAGVADDVKNKKRPRRPKAFEFKKLDDRLDKMLRELKDLRVPPPIDPGDSEYDAGAEVRKGDKASLKKAVEKLIAFNRALRAQVAAIRQCEKDLQESAARGKLVHRAATRMAEAVEDIYKAPGVDALFRGMFGYAWLDLELVLAPKLADVRDEAEGKAKVFEREREEREKSLHNHTSNLKTIAKAAGLSLPSDIRD